MDGGRGCPVRRDVSISLLTQEKEKNLVRFRVLLAYVPLCAPSTGQSKSSRWIPCSQLMCDPRRTRTRRRTSPPTASVPITWLLEYELKAAAVTAFTESVTVSMPNLKLAARATRRGGSNDEGGYAHEEDDTRMLTEAAAALDNVSVRGTL